MSHWPEHFNRAKFARDAFVGADGSGDTSEENVTVGLERERGAPLAKGQLA